MFKNILLLLKNTAAYLLNSQAGQGTPIVSISQNYCMSLYLCDTNTQLFYINDINSQTRYINDSWTKETVYGC